MKFLNTLKTWLLVLIMVAMTSGAASGKSASGGINLSSGVSQSLAASKSLNALGLDDISTIGALGSPLATNSAKKVDTLKPGPFAKESIPAHRGKPTAAEQRQVNDLMKKHGCHTCGTKNAGTKSGNAVADHQPAQALGDPKKFFPHCINCARRQGGQVRQEQIKRQKK